MFTVIAVYKHTQHTYTEAQIVLMSADSYQFWFYFCQSYFIFSGTLHININLKNPVPHLPYVGMKLALGRYATTTIHED